VRRQVYCSEHAWVAIVLWIAGTYGYRLADVFPRLAILSEMRRCGKSTLLKTIHRLAFASELADNISPAAMYRSIAARPMTLCIDEYDSFARDDSGIRNIVNAGYSRDGRVKRVEKSPDGKTWEVVDFPCFCPVAIVAIGRLPDTVQDRSVIVRLQRAPKKNGVGKRRLRTREMARVRQHIVPQLLAHAERIEAAIYRGASRLPQGLHDRAMDNWDPLIAVAELAGGDWPARARAAAEVLSGSADDDGLVEKLLRDIRFVVEAPRRHAIDQWRAWSAGGRVGARPTRLPRSQWPTAIRTQDLYGRLVLMEHRPWADCNRGREITMRWLADRLKGLGVEPDRDRVPPWQFDCNGEPDSPPLPLGPGKDRRLRVYFTDELRDVWRRCL
jgi:hypothetical protein